MAKDMKKAMEKMYGDVLKYIENARPIREKHNFQRKQLQFLKADVQRPKLPFRRAMLVQEHKKERKAALAKRKRDMGLQKRYKTRKSKQSLI